MMATFLSFLKIIIERAKINIRTFVAVDLIRILDKGTTYAISVFLVVEGALLVEVKLDDFFK